MAMHIGGGYNSPPPGSWPIIIGGYLVLIALILALTVWL